METTIPSILSELQAAVVGIAGAGGLGSNVAVALTRLKVGKLIIADFDVVELSNLTRQQYYLDQIGKPKVEAMSENLRRIDQQADIEIHMVKLDAQNVPEIFAEADVIAECFDKPDQKQMLVETILAKMEKTIVVSASGLAGYGRSNDIATTQISRRHIMVGDGVSAAEDGEKLTASRVGLVAYHQANAIVEVIVDQMQNRNLRS